MEQSWSFIHRLCASEFSLLNEACKLSRSDTVIHSTKDIYSFIEHHLGHQVSSYSDLLHQLNKVYSSNSGLFNAINLSEISSSLWRLVMPSNTSTSLEEDTRCLAHILLWMLLEDDKARAYVAKEESIRNTSKEVFEEEYIRRLGNSKKFVQKVPFYALTLSGLGEAVQQNGDLRWLTVSSAVGVGLSAYAVTNVLALGPILGTLTILLGTIFSLMGFSNKSTQRAAPFWVALIFIHLSSSMSINSEQMAKDFCRGLIDDDYLQVPDDFKSGNSQPTKRELFDGWNSIRVGLVIYLWASLPESGVIFVQKGKHVFVKDLWKHGELNKDRLNEMIQDLFEHVPLRKLEELHPYAAALIDYLYGLDVGDSLKEKYLELSKHYTALSGSKLLLDYSFPYTQVDPNTYCYCNPSTPQGFMTLLYLIYQGLDDSHCLYNLDNRQFDCVLVPPVSYAGEYEKYLSAGGQMISIETKLEKPQDASVDLDTEYAVVRHDVLKRFEEIAFDIDMQQYEVAKRELRSLKDWLATYFMGKKSVAPVDIEKVLHEQFDGDFTLQMEKFGFSAQPLVRVNESDLVIRVLQNLADNFKNHAFVSMPTKEQRQVRVKLTDYQNFIEIRISNNGEPIPEELSSDTIFELGVKGKVTGHLGYGCWSMKRCLQCYGGDIRLETHNSLFPTTFILTLPNYKSHGNAEN